MRERRAGIKMSRRVSTNIAGLFLRGKGHLPHDDSALAAELVLREIVASAEKSEPLGDGLPTDYLFVKFVHF